MGKTKLTHKQQAFINEYLRSWNAAKAARDAGYSERTAGIIGYENLTKPYIKAEIDRRVEEMIMEADEVLARLGSMARSSFADFMTMQGRGVPVVDWQKAYASGAIDNVKEITFEKDGSLKVKLYDKQAALVHIAKHLGLFKEQVDVTFDWREEAKAEGHDPDALVEEFKQYMISQVDVSDEL